MASLQGLPALPKSLKSLLSAGSDQWKETEKIHQLKTSIQQDFSDSSVADDLNLDTLVSQEEQKRTIFDQSSNRHKIGYRQTRKISIDNLQSGIAHLRKEMVSLRQLDMSLLCQLWRLNENIQDYKNYMHDRAETNSECSSYGMENGLDAIPTIEEEEHEYENESFHSHNYENEAFHRRGSAGDPAKEEPIYEPVYLEPQHYRGPPLEQAPAIPQDKPWFSKQPVVRTTYQTHL